MIAALCGAGCPEASRPPQVPVAKAEEEIAKGIISVTSVLGELRAPFFRVPGLRRTDTMERYLAAENLMERRFSLRRLEQYQRGTGICPSTAVRGALSNERPYRDLAARKDDAAQQRGRALAERDLWNSRQRGRALWHATRALFEPFCF
jgi:hypothetical protein